MAYPTSRLGGVRVSFRDRANHTNNLNLAPTLITTDPAQNPEKQNPERTNFRMEKIPNWKKCRIGQNPELDKIPNGQKPERKKSRTGQIPEWTKSRIGQNFESDKIPNGQNPESDKIPNGQNPERTKSRIKPTSQIEKVRINSVLTAGL